MGKKYTIELKDNQTLYIAEKDEDGVLCFFPAILSTCKELDLEQVRKEAYDKGYDDCRDELNLGEIKNDAFSDGYKCGLTDLYEAVRKIMNPLQNYKDEVFDGRTAECIFDVFTASKVIAKIKEYEDSKQKIKVGDEVEDGVANLVVLEINEDGTVEGYTDYGSVIHATPRKKTGRYFPEVAALLKNMKGK